MGRKTLKVLKYMEYEWKTSRVMQVLMARNDVTQEQVGEFIGKSGVYIGAILKRGVIPDMYVRLLSDYLKCDPQWLAYPKIVQVSSRAWARDFLENIEREWEKEFDPRELAYINRGKHFVGLSIG